MFPENSERGCRENNIQKVAAGTITNYIGTIYFTEYFLRKKTKFHSKGVSAVHWTTPQIHPWGPGADPGGVSGGPDPPPPPIRPDACLRLKFLHRQERISLFNWLIFF